MMAIEKEARFGSCEEVAAALETARREAPLSPAGKLPPGRRKRLLATAAGGLALLVLLAISAALFGTGPGPGEDARQEGDSRASQPEPPAVEAADAGSFHGRVDSLPGGRIRFRYDFEDAREIEDWEPLGSRAELHDGCLDVSNGSPAVVRFRAPLRVEKLRVVAACLSAEWSPHINLYLNTEWNGNWEGSWGVACILRGDKGLLCVDGTERDLEGVPPCALQVKVEQEIELASSGDLAWKVDGKTVSSRPLPEIAGRSGSLLIGAYEALVRFDWIEFEGILVEER